ncbi:hypothetical protein [Marinospirillum insulare]|uniref:dTDP-4-amino-4,6-dideoxygalactose transaminase n=1 Tax=Marinospirillum insulare TaxID=217169 RepID=A0ABQ5ZY01_9GAMM|nr:hypothetical protein [Marinospirillum insulare]GLR65076.1 hypothetical protein GCM10007878_25150 [Marinospirillum insulare]
MQINNKPIGGYFELELPKSQNYPYPEAFKYQSARSAFYALLEKIKPSKVYMPRYICDTMIAPLRALAIDIDYYSISKDLDCKFTGRLKDNEILFYVNYFGLCTSHQENLLKKYPANQLVFDHSQAFFQKPLDALATIYSPRKFFGVPDGGLLATNLDITEPEEIDTGSIDRASHLLKRLAGEPEDGYSDYQENENSLNNLQPKKMSQLTERLLASIDYESIKEIRNANFIYLHDKFKHLNELEIESFDAPLSYPLLSYQDRGVELIKKRIFTPTYWPDALDRCKGNQEEYLINNLYPLPIDQRYSKNDMDRLIISLKIN